MANVVDQMDFDKSQFSLMWVYQIDFDFPFYLGKWSTWITFSCDQEEGSAILAGTSPTLCELGAFGGLVNILETKGLD